MVHTSPVLNMFDVRRGVGAKNFAGYGNRAAIAQRERQYLKTSSDHPARIYAEAGRQKNLQESSLSLRLSQKHQWSSDDEGLPAGKDLKHFWEGISRRSGGPR